MHEYMWVDIPDLLELNNIIQPLEKEEWELFQIIPGDTLHTRYRGIFRRVLNQGY